MDSSQIIPLLFRVSATMAAMCVPLVSVAYAILRLIPDERERMATIISHGTIASIFLVSSSATSFLMLSLGYEGYLPTLVLSSGLYAFGLVRLLYSLLVLAGFRREIILPPANAVPEE